ncbi:MAG: discoidin domain-containing protein [Polyangiaceae bacterium]
MIDGNTNGDFTGASVTHTNSAQAWWQVDLGARKNIASVKLYNRTDCCADRLSNFDVLISTDGNWPPSTFKSRAGPGCLQLSVPAGVAGRYVRVQLRGTNPVARRRCRSSGATRPATTTTPARPTRAPATGCTYSTLVTAACDDGNVSTWRRSAARGLHHTGLLRRSPRSSAMTVSAPRTARSRRPSCARRRHSRCTSRRTPRARRARTYDELGTLV